MLSHSVTPMAYRSLKTLAQAILPCKAEATELDLNQTLTIQINGERHRILPSCKGRLQWGRCSLLSEPEKGLHV